MLDPVTLPRGTLIQHVAYCWDVVVRCDCGREVLITWSEMLARHPRGLGATVEALAARMRCQGCGGRPGRTQTVQGVTTGMGMNHEALADRAERLRGLLEGAGVQALYDQPPAASGGVLGRTKPAPAGAERKRSLAS